MNPTNTSTDIAGFPSYSELTDATRNSLICIGVSLFIIFVTWRSYPCCCTREVPMPDDATDEEKRDSVATVPIKINFAWPFKILTVLFHEMSHAIVGICTGGRVGYISVNAREGGATYFKPDPKHQPWLRTTLAAGYLGSCLIGCSLLGAGFDALAAKYAALALLTYLIIAIIICLSIRRKFALLHHWDKITFYAQKWLGNMTGMEDRFAKIREKGERSARKAREFSERQAQARSLSEKVAAGTASVGEKGDLQLLEGKLEHGYKEKMVSLDLIALIALIMCALIIPAWLIADSVALRFVIMFIGLFSACYAVQDVYDDGVKNYQAQGSDANVYASLMIPAPPGIDWDYDFKDPKSRIVIDWEEKMGSRTKFLARLSLIVQLFAMLITILAAVYFVRTTTAEQALESRSFLATPFHLHSADMLDKVQQGGQEGLEWGKDKLGQWMEGDEAR